MRAAQLEGVRAAGREGRLQCTVNEYPPGVGIAPHIDTHSAFEDGIASLSLGGGCAFRLRRGSDGADHSVWLPPRFMTVARAVEQLLEAEGARGGGACGPDALAVGMARLGQPDEAIVCGTLAQLRGADLGGPLHCLAMHQGGDHLCLGQ